MILFFISLIMVFISSYFITSVIAEKKSILGFIYLFLIQFANVVLTFEILSLFKGISEIGVLALNALFLIISAVVWNKYKRPFWRPEFKKFFNKYFNSIKKDKYLATLSIAFVIFVSVSLFLISFMPVVNIDAGAYHVLRSVFWINNGSLNHFTIADSRNLILPINSEILYAWVLLFVKKQAWLGIFSFVGYVLSIVSVYNILGLMHFSMRKKLWTIFMITSFSSVIVQASGTETDIIIAALVASSLFLYWYGVKKEKLCPVFMSALAYALAVGTKTPALMAVPGIGVAMILLSVHYRGKLFYKPFLQFLGFALANFVIFASYNYVLNFIDYGNFVGSAAFIQVHKNFYGIKAIPANFIKYFFMFFDFTGFKWGDYVGSTLLDVRNNILMFMGLAGIKDGLYTTPKAFNQSLLEPLMGLGILGFLVYLPCWMWSLIRPLFCRKKQSVYLFIFGLILVINIAVMSYQLQFMMFSIRFMMFFCVLSAPVIAYSYTKKNNFYKFIVVAFSLFYMILVTTHLWARPFSRIINYYKAGYNITEIRDIATCSGFLRNPSSIKNKNYKLLYNSESCKVADYITKNIDKKNKILYLSNTSSDLLVLKMLDFRGFQIDYGLMEEINDTDLSQYNIVMTVANHQMATNVKKYDERINDIYVNPTTANTYYRKNKANPCFYYDNMDGIITVDNSMVKHPYMTRCVLTDDYYHNHDLHFYSKYEVSSLPKDVKEEPIPIYYYFYENLNNPIKK